MSDDIGILQISDETGDRKIPWRRRKKKEETALATVEPDDVRNSRLAFEDKIKKHYDAYEFEQPGNIESGKKVTKFNPSARFIVMTPHLESGK